MGSKQTRTIILFVVGFVMGLAFVFLMSVAFYSLFFGGKEEELGEREVKHYQIYQTNTASNQSSFGFVTIYDDLGAEEFKYFKSDDGKTHTLVSHFGTPEFKCIGRCFCDENKRRSVGTKVLKKGLMYLVAASSSIAALQISRNYFENECKISMNEECSSSVSVKSEVLECKAVTEGEEEEEELDYDDDDDYNKGYKKTSQDRVGDDVKYKCEGTCKFDIGGVNEFAVRLDPIDKKIDDDCMSLFFEDVVMIPREEDSLNEQEIARKKFDKKHLTFFCRKQQPLCVGSVIGCRKLKDVRFHVDERQVPWGRAKG